jgi:hypothetical protein
MTFNPTFVTVLFYDPLILKLVFILEKNRQNDQTNKSASTKTDRIK